jgi:hypothetical protein
MAGKSDPKADGCQEGCFVSAVLFLILAALMFFFGR